MHKLLSYLADRFTELGAIQFQKAVATFATEPNREVNHYDGAVLYFYGQLALALIRNPQQPPLATAIVQRYAAAQSWAAASDAATRFYGIFLGTPAAGPPSA